MAWKDIPKHLWQNTSVRTWTEQQRKWFNLCDTSRALKWMWNFWCPEWQDKPPPHGWTNHQLLQFAATLMNEGKAETLRAALLLLLWEDLKELVDQRIEEKYGTVFKPLRRNQKQDRSENEQLAETKPYEHEG